MHVADTLTQNITATGSIACVGLDPRPHLIPSEIRAQAAEQCDQPLDVLCAAFEMFNIAVLDAIAGHCAAIKPQVACYEAYGWRGMRVLEKSIAKAHQLHIPVIVDGKRNDIGSTATHYQQAWLGDAPGFDDEPLQRIGADWLTINAYLGSDGVDPFLDDNNQHGIFALVKTSNPSSGDLQNQACGKTTVMAKMAQLVAQWGEQRLGNCGLSSVGAVVGATWPDEARSLRTLMPHAIFLVPGYGAQGGGAEDALAGLRDDGQGVLVNSLRGIIGAWQQSNATFAQATKEALITMNEDLNQYRP
ncbi:MAG: orotidine-5'-phosphate decarboxylase [Planctomycetes bacterium]|nr:orotidine-5'-phosphate decarboxylase [Planctomycetota bacterium]